MKRGYWVVCRVLGERIPPPPPTVPELPSNKGKLGNQTLRQVLEVHRRHPACAGCHARFDSFGLVFEGYRPVGERRARLVEPSGARELITAKDFERLDANAQRLIRAYERTIKDLFERWTELKPKRVAQDPETRREARDLSDDVRRELCQELNGLLGFIS